MRKIAVIGASAFQNKLIEKAKNLGFETHVFAWGSGEIGEKTCDFFYPISIVDKEAIAKKCRELDIDAVATTGTDLGNITVAYVADALKLTWNSVDCVARSTNKHLMRRTFEENGDPSPKSLKVTNDTVLTGVDFDYPVIVKPSDRSGSRGITKLESSDGLKEAISLATYESLEGAALIEEFARGREFSVEYISWRGVHRFLAITEKFTTGAPHFIEMGHLEPARIGNVEAEVIKAVVEHALTSLGVMFGASHSEVKLDETGKVKIIEIGSRMGGDCIGSDLVELSTGYDYVEAVIDCAMGKEPKEPTHALRRHAMIRFVFSQKDLDILAKVKNEAPSLLKYESPIDNPDHEIVDSSTRLGFYILVASTLDELMPYLPEDCSESQ